MNRHIATVIIAPMTSTGNAYPSRIPCEFEDKTGQIVLDQLRTVDKKRLVKRLGELAQESQKQVLATLAEMFTE